MVKPVWFCWFASGALGNRDLKPIWLPGTMATALINVEDINSCFYSTGVYSSQGYLLLLRPLGSIRQYCWRYVLVAVFNHFKK